MRLRRTSFVFVSLLAISACGGSTTGDSSSGVERTNVAASLPDVEVIDVAAGSTVNLRSLLPSDRPVLLWFWAPH